MPNTFKSPTYGKEFVESIKQDAATVESKIGEMGQDLKDRGMKISKQVVKQVRTNPFIYMGGISVASWTIGYLMGRSRSA